MGKEWWRSELLDTEGKDFSSITNSGLKKNSLGNTSNDKSFNEVFGSSFDDMPLRQQIETAYDYYDKPQSENSGVKNYTLEAKPMGFAGQMNTGNAHSHNTLQEPIKNAEYHIQKEEDIKRQALEYANKIKQNILPDIDIENAMIMNNNALTPMQKIGKMTWNNYKNFNPGRRIGEAAGELSASKKEMEEVKEPGYDNYAHRYGMYTNAKDGPDKALYSLGGGVLKEVKDIYDKSIIGNKTFRDSVKDSYKDMRNNMEAVYEGTVNNLKNIDVDGRLWLNDFDYRQNKWKTK